MYAIIQFRFVRRIALLRSVWVLFAATLAAANSLAADLDSARKQFIAGNYSNCVAECEQAIADREYEEEWRTLLAKSLVAIGKYEKAGLVISNALDRYSWSIPVRLLAHDVLPYVGETNRPAELLREI